MDGLFGVCRGGVQPAMHTRYAYLLPAMHTSQFKLLEYRLRRTQGSEEKKVLKTPSYLYRIDLCSSFSFNFKAQAKIARSIRVRGILFHWSGEHVD